MSNFDQAYYDGHLRDIHDALILHEVAQQYLSAKGIRYDGVDLQPDSTLSFYGAPEDTISGLEFAHLFGIFNSSRVHAQAQHQYSMDDAPPGLYFSIVHPFLTQAPHKNRFGVISFDTEEPQLLILDLFLDLIKLSEKLAPPRLGSISFALTAITAFRLNFRKISLVAAGGRNFDPKMIGYWVWPKLGFDALVEPHELASASHLAACTTVLQVVATDEQWWKDNGSQRLMTFDLAPGSASWVKLLSYVQERVLSGDRDAC